MKRQYRMPNGEVTTNPKKYIDSWHNLFEPFEKLTGLKVWGFDPDVAFKRTKDTRIGNDVDIPVWLLNLINGLINESKTNTKSRGADSRNH